MVTVIGQNHEYLPKIHCPFCTEKTILEGEAVSAVQSRIQTTKMGQKIVRFNCSKCGHSVRTTKLYDKEDLTDKTFPVDTKIEYHAIAKRKPLKIYDWYIYHPTESLFAKNPKNLLFACKNADCLGSNNEPSNLHQNVSEPVLKKEYYVLTFKCTNCKVAKRSDYKVRLRFPVKVYHELQEMSVKERQELAARIRTALGENRLEMVQHQVDSSQCECKICNTCLKKEMQKFKQQMESKLDTLEEGGDKSRMELVLENWQEWEICYCNECSSKQEEEEDEHLCHR